MMRDRKQGSGNGDQGEDGMVQLLRSAVPAMGDLLEPHHRDLWPAMLRRFDEESMHRVSRVPWFDWVLASGLVAFAAIAPRTIPVILYYL